MEIKLFEIIGNVIEPRALKAECSGIAQQKVLQVSSTTTYQKQARQYENCRRSLMGL
jgi:hypothetical protein